MGADRKRCAGHRRHFGHPHVAHAHISERMNAFLLGAIPLLSGASVFLIRFLFLSPYFVHKEHKAQSDGKIQALEQQLSRYLDTDRKRRDENARNVLDRASGLLKEAKYPTSFQSLYPAGAADLETNEQLIW